MRVARDPPNAVESSPAAPPPPARPPRPPPPPPLNVTPRPRLNRRDGSATRVANTRPLSATNIVLPSTLYATVVRRPLPSKISFVSLGPYGGTQLMKRTLLGVRTPAAPLRPAFPAPRPPAARPPAAGSVPDDAKTDWSYTSPGPTGFHCRVRLPVSDRSEEHTSELQSQSNLV